MNPIPFIANKINAKRRDKYNIVCFSTHEAYQEALAKTGHQFYLLEMEGMKKWNEQFRRIPKNCTIINNFDQIPKDADFLLSQDRYYQIQTMMNLSNGTRLPIVHVDHVEPIKDANFEKLRGIEADINVFITQHNKNSWENKNGTVIPHGIDMNVFNGWKPNKSKSVVYTVNYLKDRDFFCGWTEWNYIKNKVASIDPSITFKLIGDNPGISTTISNPTQLASEINKNACYINTSKFSPVPMSLLEAMSCGIPVVSTRYQQVADLLNESNAVSSNNLDELADAIVNICNNNSVYTTMGASARETIKSNYSMDSFINNWNAIFEKAYNLTLGKQHEIFFIQ
jgi:glycosyltransferase involved in cell wall biosynthesis